MPNDAPSPTSARTKSSAAPRVADTTSRSASAGNSPRKARAVARRTLAADDEIWVQDATETWYLYTVTWTAAFATDDAPLFEIAGYAPSPLLTMITCGGNRNPANADFGGNQAQGRPDNFTAQV